MKMIYSKVLNKTIAALFLGGIVLSSGCKYQEIEDADYPDQKLYMTTAVSAANTTYDKLKDGIYRVSLVATPGLSSRYVADIPGNRLNVPLGVGRSGVNIDGNTDVSIAVNTDTIAALKLKETLSSDVLLLPADKFTIPSSVVLPGGATSVNFPVSIDLAYLVQNPDKKFAIGVDIASSTLMVNPVLKTTILLVNTKFLFPKAAFTAASDATTTDQVNFSTTSEHSLNYEWDFGDGTAISKEVNPKHVYVNPGQYTVKLTALGVMGETTKSSITKTFILPASNFTWALDPVTSRKVNFVSTSTNAVRYEWDFGDGSAKVTTSSASRTFAQAGTYNVKLTVASDAEGLYKRTKTIAIVVP